jgi:hypothetical protein
MGIAIPDVYVNCKDIAIKSSRTANLRYKTYTRLPPHKAWRQAFDDAVWNECIHIIELYYNVIYKNWTEFHVLKADTLYARVSNQIYKTKKYIRRK